MKPSSSANTFPYIEAQNSYTKIEHEASTSRIAEEQLFYLLQRGIDLNFNNACNFIS